MLSEQQPKVPMIDDHGTVRESFRRNLEDQGHSICETANRCEQGFKSADMLEEPFSLMD